MFRYSKWWQKIYFKVLLYHLKNLNNFCNISWAGYAAETHNAKVSAEFGVYGVTTAEVKPEPSELVLGTVKWSWPPQDRDIYVLWRLAGIALLNVFYSKKEAFSGRRSKCCHEMMNGWNDGIFPRDCDYSWICPSKGQINYFQNLCEKLSLIRNLRIQFFLCKWHILKWEAKLYLSKSDCT